MESPCVVEKLVATWIDNYGGDTFILVVSLVDDAHRLTA